MSRLAQLALVLPFLTGLYMIFLAVGRPEQLSEMLGGLAATGPVGKASLYADFAAYFLTYTIGVGAALFRNKRDWLFAPIALFGLTMVFRIFHGLSHGFEPAGVQLIVSELVMCALMIFAWRSKPVS
ncbi:MAG: hypothetical protein AAFP97_00370 [Pseudomonadota bacterium]